MEEKYLKDFVISLVVILLLAFGMNNVSLLRKVETIPKESKYAGLVMGEELLSQIKEIESSIQDRKDFVFTVEKDPLEQNLIVKTMKDLQTQWRRKIENMVRLESTIIPENGEKRAAITYKGSTTIYKIGDDFIKGNIIDIEQGTVTYNYKGTVGTINVKKLPEKPVEIQENNKTKKNRQYNW